MIMNTLFKRIPTLLISCYLFLFVFLCFLLSYRPVYYDEIAYRITNSRIFFDGFFKISYYFPVCKAIEQMDAPLLWIPGRIIDGILFYLGKTPWSFRFIGTLMYITWLAGTANIASKILDHKKSKYYFAVIMIAFSTVGVLPAMMVWTRPENELLIALSFFLFFPLYTSRIERPSFRKAVFEFILFLLMASWCLPLHSKSVLFIPLMCLSFCYSFHPWRVTRSISLLGGLYLASLSFASYKAHTYRNSYCPESNGGLNKIFSSLNLMPEILFQDPKSFFEGVYVNLSNTKCYFERIFFLDSYPVHWLPPGTMSGVSADLLNNLIRLAIFLAAILIPMEFIAACSNFSKKPSFQSSQKILLPLSFIVSLFILNALQITKHMYESIIFIGSIPLTLVYLFSTNSGSTPLKTIRFLMMISIVGISILSQIHLCKGLYTLYSDKSFAGAGYPAARSASYEEDSRNLESLAKQCNLDPRKSHHVGGDLPAYFFFLESERPFLLNFHNWLLAVSFPEAPDAWKQSLKDLNSSGVIADCSFIPGELHHLAKKEGNFCCIGKDQLQ